MVRETFETLLARSLDDLRLSRGERSALRDLLDRYRPTVREQEVLLHAAFKLARERARDEEDGRIIEWLEDVVKVLRPAEPLEVSGSRVAEVLFFPSDNSLNRLVDLLKTARHSLDVCVYTITHDRLYRAIVNAHKRGAEVRVLTDDEKMNDPGSDILKLSQAGIEVRTDNSPSLLHHKFVIMDGKTLLTGSFNWTRSAAVENQENILVTDDPLFIEAYQKEFHRLWAEFK